ncbi:MAG: aminotransferase class I/II-fold pyridoxal phosphate-dependent enzyme [Erysipelotrichia bacterium]|nr:aminotransferase class I/II-fold pyridoxal phosphate-dependent enzyme [Erysipelotrichia bacterium]NCC55097.1 aminotransferase class I/II-fold pyridoxal phosphate-dependent enzyme [Erysipelotrichia bacterium]
MKTFIREHVDAKPIVDNVFAIVKLANAAKEKFGAENVVDATIGSLYDEAGKLVAFDSVFTHYNEIENRNKAKYAASFNGNADFREQVYKWVKQDADVQLKHTVVATPGGSGAVSTTMVDVLDCGECVVIPEIAWGSYKLMAMMANLNVETYQLFDEEHFNVDHFREVCTKVMEKQGKLLAIINDPCHNPTGYSLTIEEWNTVIDVLNTLSEKGPVVLLNDIAYIDFAYDFASSRNYLETFNRISDNVLVVVAFSCSKTLTSYGLRCGAALIMGQNEENVRQLEIVMEKSARATWSNIPNAAMDNFVYVTTTGYDAFDKEKAMYVNLLKQRSDIFTSEAKACNLMHYPYKEGFFVTLRIEDQELLNKYHQALMDHNIFTVKVNKGIRVAICSLSVENCYGLAKRMKDILESIEK